MDTTSAEIQSIVFLSFEVTNIDRFLLETKAMQLFNIVPLK